MTNTTAKLSDAPTMDFRTDSRIDSHWNAHVHPPTVMDASFAENLRELQWQLDATAAIAELMMRIAAAESCTDARLVTVNALREYLGADLVALGVPKHSSAIVEVTTISDVASVDHSALWTDAISAAMSEAIIRHRHTDTPITIANKHASDHPLMQLAHDRLLKTTDSQCVWSCPLVDSDAEVVAVWTAIFLTRPSQFEAHVRFVKASAAPLAAAFDGAARAGESTFPRFKRTLKKRIPSSRRKAIACGTAAVLAVLALPIPHRVACPTALEATGQRFSVAPHDGILEKTFVRAGDSVYAGQLLAQMDDTDLQLQIADLVAQKERAEKKTDIHRAASDAAATQLARLETVEINAQLQRLRSMSDNRRITSGIDGLVLNCETEHAHGVPVRTGDTLMQIAPLDTLRAELEIAPQDFAHVRVGQSFQLIADGNPLTPINGTIAKIRPISETRSARNVFIAEVMIDNGDGRLRPGMAGHGKINAGWRCLAWVVFHHAIEKTYGWLR